MNTAAEISGWLVRCDTERGIPIDLMKTLILIVTVP